MGPQVSFFYGTIKPGFYMKVLKNGLCFNSVWSQSLNLSHSPLGASPPTRTAALKRLCSVFVLLFLFIFVIHTHSPVV